MSKTKGSFTKKSSKRHQQFYKMKGCSKKTRKNYLGGSSDAPLAYTGKPILSQSNPFLAYTGKGGGSSVDMLNKSNVPINTNVISPAYPNTGPIPNSNIVYNSALPQNGGSCGCGLPFMSGGEKNKNGGCGPFCAMGFMVGGTRHRKHCKCSECKKRINRHMKGGNPGIPYPDGLVGSPWTPSIGGWPGVSGVPGDSNYIPQNQLKIDTQTSMINEGANPPFTVGGKKRRQKGGTLSNFISQDLINLGRQFQFGLGSAYNALAGYSSPVNPMPWKGQFPVGAPMNPVKPIV